MKKNNNKQTTITTNAKTEAFIGWYKDLGSFHALKARKRVITDLLIDSKKCNQSLNSLSTSIRLNFERLQMQNIKLNCNVTSAFQYNDCPGQ